MAKKRCDACDELLDEQDPVFCQEDYDLAIDSADRAARLLFRLEKALAGYFDGEKQRAFHTEIQNFLSGKKGV